MNHDALEAGFRRNGWEVMPEATIDGYPDVDAVMMRGLKGHKREVRDVYVKRGTPVAVLECGWFKRAGAQTVGYSQLGQARIGWLPKGPLPSDRWDALNLPIMETPFEPGGPVILAGQVPNDAQHELTPWDMTMVYGEMISEIRKAIKVEGRKAEIVYRPHPQGNPDFEWPVTQEGVPFDQGIAGARGVATYNSTVGTECIRRGVPVYCSTTANYYELSAGPSVAHVAEYKEREQFLWRMAYGQWHTRELESGEAVANWIEHAGQWREMMDFQLRGKPETK